MLPFFPSVLTLSGREGSGGREGWQVRLEAVKAMQGDAAIFVLGWGGVEGGGGGGDREGCAMNHCCLPPLNQEEKLLVC